MPGDLDGPGALARFDTPCAVLVDRQGRILVADTRNDALKAIDAAGNVITLARALPGNAFEKLHRPVSPAQKKQGILVIATLGGELLEIDRPDALPRSVVVLFQKRSKRIAKHRFQPTFVLQQVVDDAQHVGYQVMLLDKVAEVRDRGLVRQPVQPAVELGEFPQDLPVAQRFLHSRGAQSEPLLHVVNP